MLADSRVLAQACRHSTPSSLGICAAWRQNGGERVRMPKPCCTAPRGEGDAGAPLNPQSLTAWFYLRSPDLVLTLSVKAFCLLCWRSPAWVLDHHTRTRGHPHRSFGKVFARCCCLPTRTPTRGIRTVSFYSDVLRYLVTRMRSVPPLPPACHTTTHHLTEEA